MEIELKLAIDPSAVATFRCHPLLAEYARQAPAEDMLESIYYDTPDFLLQRQNAALRVRRTRAGWVQTLKAGGSVIDGVHSRLEWEMPVPGDRLDLIALLARMEGYEDWRALIASPDLGEKLVPVFTTRFHRTAWMLHLPQGAVVECALDEGEVFRDSQEGHDGARVSTVICEVELELKQGDAACLGELAAAFQATIAMQASDVSKAERGYRLAGL